MPIAAFLGVSHTIDRLHDRELAAALGDMVVAWSAAEYTLISVFATITATPWPMASAAYYRIPTYEARTKVLLAMLGKWETDRYAPAVISDEIEALNRLAKKRNHWVHGYWVQEMLGKAVSTFDMRAEPRAPRPVKAADIANHVEAVQKRARVLRELLRPPEGRAPKSGGS